MRIAILAMDDPLYTNSFIKHIIDEKQDELVAYVHVSRGNRLTTGKSSSRLRYLFSLFLIMGPVYFFRNSFIYISHRLKKKLSSWGLVEDPTVLGYAREKGIKALKTEDPNSKEFCRKLEGLKPDVIVNQSQAVIKKGLLEVPKIGVINRHNALLPKNRGRLSPFWALYKGEKETGVSIHFVEEELDSGDIIVQKRFDVSQDETFNSLVNRSYGHAKEAIVEALDKLESGDYELMDNNDEEATYNSLPTVGEAWEYRKGRLFG